MNYSKEDIVKKFITAYNSVDIESMLSLLHADVQFKNISNGEADVQTVGIDQFKMLAKQSALSFKEREQKIISIEEMNNKVTVEIQYRAIVATDLPNGLKSGDKIDIRGKSEYIFKDSLIFSIVDES